MFLYADGPHAGERSPCYPRQLQLPYLASSGHESNNEYIYILNVFELLWRF
jgi:hypothetical protein